VEENKVLNRAWKVILLAVAVYVGLGIYSDLEKLLKAFISFNWTFLVVIVILTLINYFVRFLKWHYLLNRIVDVNAKESLWVFLSGFIMTITPGKLGEIWRAWLLKEIEGINVSKTIPVVLTDRLTDVIGLTTLALLGILTYGRGMYLAVIVFGGFLCFIIFLRSQALSNFLISKLENRFLQYSSDVKLFHESLLRLVRVRELLLASFLASFSWFFECLGLYVAVIGFDDQISILQAVFAFSFSSVAGALSMVPGGIGVAEASITGLLQYFGMSLEVAVASTLIIRFGTLWLGVIIGWMVYVSLRNKF